MAQLPIGSLLTVSVSAQTDGFSSASDTFAAVSAILQGSGIHVFNPIIQQSALAVIGAAGYASSFQVTFVASSGSAYGDPNDLVSIVANAFYQATGTLPISAAYTNIAPPGTPQPGSDPVNGPGGGSSDLGIGDAIKKALSGLQTTTITILVSIAAIIVLVLVLLAYSPHAGKTAAAFA